jgi:fibronectin-binding autotransporter adhesin
VNGAIAATQSLISSVVNRPSAALITSLVNPEDDPCVLGNWGRVTGGRAEATLVSSSGGLQATNNIEMTYRGFQVGLDRSCTYGGDATDLAYGAIMGMNTGSSSLPVFAYDVISQDFDSDQAAVTFVENEFQQTFGGAYLSAAQGDLSGDVLVRMDRTEYDISETSDFANEGLGLEDQTYESRGTTLSGSVSYTTTVDETRGILFTPTVGFSFSRIENDNIAIVGDPADPTDDSTLVIDDIEQQIGLIGGTLRRTQVLPGNNSALTYFTTATYFKDFSGNQNATLELNGTEADIVSENLGGFGELSIGVNYTDLLGEGSRIPARQLDTSIRLDSRFSNKLDSWGITAQLRLQF